MSKHKWISYSKAELIDFLFKNNYKICTVCGIVKYHPIAWKGISYFDEKLNFISIENITCENYLITKILL